MHSALGAFLLVAQPCMAFLALKPPSSSAQSPNKLFDQLPEELVTRLIEHAELQAEVHYERYHAITSNLGQKGLTWDAISDYTVKLDGALKNAAYAISEKRLDAAEIELLAVAKSLLPDVVAENLVRMSNWAGRVSFEDPMSRVVPFFVFPALLFGDFPSALAFDQGIFRKTEQPNYLVHGHEYVTTVRPAAEKAKAVGSTFLSRLYRYLQNQDTGGE